MNPYQNPYVQNPYGNPYMQPSAYANQYGNNTFYPQSQMNQNNQQVSQQAMLNGKIVDSADVVRVTEVPMGGYGVFPKADMSEVYVKSWNNNGTTSIMTYRPVQSETPEKKEDVLATEILQKLNAMENKLNDTLARLNSAQARSEVMGNEPTSRNEYRPVYANDERRSESASNGYVVPPTERRE